MREAHAQTLPPPLVGPIQEQTTEVLAGLGASMLDNIMSLHQLAPAEDRAMLTGSAFQTIRLTNIAASLMSDPRPPDMTELDEFSAIRAATVSITAAAAATYSSAAEYFADPPPSPMSPRSTFDDFAEAGRAELRLQADWLSSQNPKR